MNKFLLCIIIAVLAFALGYERGASDMSAHCRSLLNEQTNTTQEN